MKMIREYTAKIGALFKYYCLMILSFFSKGEEKGCVLMDVTDLPINRRTVQVFLQLRNTGYHVYLKFQTRQFINTFYYRNTDYQNILFENIKLYNRRKQYDVVFCSEKKAECYEKSIVFDDDDKAFGKQCEDHFCYPLLPHPVKLARTWESDLIASPLDTRIGFVFIGSTGDAYTTNKAILHQKYHVETRSEVIDALQSRFSDRVFRPNSKEQLMAKLADGNNDLIDRIVIIDRFRLDGSEYSNILRLSAFHLWTSGYIQPYCHNQTEGMICGCIPVYNRNIYYPGLSSENAYPYTDLDDLESLIRILLRRGINASAVITDRERIRQNYIDHLSLQSFHHKLAEFITSDRKKEIYYISSR